MSLVATTPKKSSGPGLIILGLVGIAALGAGGVVLKRELTLPAPATVSVTPDKPGIGPRTAFVIRALEPEKGIAKLTVVANGAGLNKKVISEQVTTPAEDGTSPREVAVTVELGREVMPELIPGTLTLDVTVQALGTRLKTPAPVVNTTTADVKFDPPSISALSQFIHPAQGGAEVVVYEVGPSSVQDGVRVGAWFFPGYALPGGTPAQRFALFAVPYDLELSEGEAKSKIMLSAMDALGNHLESPFIHKFFPRPMGRDVIDLKEAFMQKVTSEIFARTPELRKTGAVLDDYLTLNKDLRKSNMDELKTLAARTQQKFLWANTFAPMQNAAVKGSFADRRTYSSNGKAVDTQDHLGFDLASVERAPVQASNGGLVVLSRYFGIFGNCVVIDHGYGLMTLYAHLSTIGVKEGDAVTQGQEIGRTGATGLAGGDHLHFTTVLHGLPVNPIEWWDSHWIKDRLKLKLTDALPWTGTASK